MYEELERRSKENLAVNLKEHAEFKAAFVLGKCYLCDGQLGQFQTAKPCLHWFLRPKKLKNKKIIKEILEGEYSYFQITEYLCWVANVDKPVRNISNLREEIDESRKLELTIRFKDLEWAFSSTLTDYEGHIGAVGSGAASHFHFQMRIAGRAFIKFDQTHVPFTKLDLMKFAVAEQNERVMLRGPRAFGLQEILDYVDPDQLLDSMTPADPDDALFNTGTLILANEGETLSGDKIADLIKRKNEEGVSFAKLAAEEFDNVESVISYGEGASSLVKRNNPRSKT
jgi:hypothetical protein